jgi:hypothetical protein
MILLEKRHTAVRRRALNLAQNYSSRTMPHPGVLRCAGEQSVYERRSVSFPVLDIEINHDFFRRLYDRYFSW